MYRFLSILLAVLLLSALLAGCTSEVPMLPQNHSNSNYVNFDLQNIYVQDILDTLPRNNQEVLPDEILAETDIYTYYRKNGACYLNFKSGNHRISLDLDEKDSCDHRFWFDSMEEAYQWLCSPVFTAHIEEIFRHCWPLDPDNGFLMPDPQRLYVCETPEEYELKSVDFNGWRFTLIYQTKERLKSGRHGAFVISSTSVEGITNWLKKYYRFDQGTTTHKIDISHNVGDHNSSVYEYETANWKHRYIHYLLEEENRILFYEERYIVSTDYPSKNYHLAEVVVFGCEKGIYYSLSPHYSDWEPFFEVIPKIALIEYQP